MRRAWNVPTALVSVVQVVLLEVDAPMSGLVAAEAVATVSGTVTALPCPSRPLNRMVSATTQTDGTVPLKVRATLSKASAAPVRSHTMVCIVKVS